MKSKGLSRVFSNTKSINSSVLSFLIVQLSRPYMTTGKDLNVGKYRRQEEKGTTEDEMVG